MKRTIPTIVLDAWSAAGDEDVLKFMLKWDVISDPLANPFILQYRLAYQATTQDEYDAIAGLNKPFENIQIADLQLQEIREKVWCDYSDDEEKSLAYKSSSKARAKKRRVDKWIVYYSASKPIAELIINHLMPDKITENEVGILRKMANLDNLEGLSDCDQTIILDVFSRAGFEDNPGAAVS